MLTAIFLKKDNINDRIGKIKSESGEKEKLAKVVNEMAEYRLLGLVLEKLEEKDKQLFLEQIYGSRPEIIVEFLREKIQDAETIISEHANRLELEIIKDLEDLDKD